MTKVDLMFDAVHDTQQIYRKLLDCMARPGKLNSIEPFVQSLEHGDLFPKPLLSLAYTLVDREVSFHVISDQTENIQKNIHWQTFSPYADLHEADYVFIGKQLSNDEIGELMKKLMIGTLEDPHISATVLIAVNALAEVPGDGWKLRLTGPGIQGVKDIYIDGLPCAWIAERNKLTSEFPLGIDMILTTDTGDMIAIPRTTVIESEAV